MVIGALGKENEALEKNIMDNYEKYL